MIFRARFRNDRNVLLMQIQAERYSENIVHLLTGPRDRYRAAASLLRSTDRLSAALETFPSFDHRTLEEPHDLIAACFRHSYSEGYQLRLGEDDAGNESRMSRDWCLFFQKEIEALTPDDEFTRAVCTAAAFGHQQAGTDAETWLERHLLDRYENRDLFLNSRNAGARKKGTE